MISPRFPTLIDMLEFRAAHSPAAVAFTFQGFPNAYAELWREINRFGAFLQGLALQPGDRVVLTLPNGPEFFAAFYGCQRAGCVPVPLFPGSGSRRLLSIAGLCGSKAVILPDGTPTDQLQGLKRAGTGRGLHVAAFSECEPAGFEAGFPELSPEDLAMIQYTSGSTGDPKGVQLTHRNLLVNVAQMVAGMQITEAEVFVSWLPAYHDMGLILMTMAPFYMGAGLHLLPANLKDVGAWLRAIEAHQGTFTAAPDFAYRLCLRYVEPEEYDLSSLRVALNAAEPVRAGTLHGFEAAFGLKNVMAAAYGLAEATVGVSMWPPNTPARVDGRGFVSVGPPFPGVEVQIVDGKNRLPAGQIGEVVFRSPANTRGYYDNPDATRQLKWRDGFLRSGDLGYVDQDGYLFITGRLKNIIKRSGQTIWPQEVEEIVDQQPAVRYSAAIGVERGRIEGEQVYVFAEVRQGESRSESELHDIALGIVDTLYGQLGFRPGRVYLLNPRAIPLTYNGKIQHALLKERYLEGALRRGGAILYPDY